MVASEMSLVILQLLSEISTINIILNNTIHNAKHFVSGGK